MSQLARGPRARLPVRHGDNALDARAVAAPTSPTRLTESQLAATAWLRGAVESLRNVPRPGCGATVDRWRALIGLGRVDLARARLAEGHLDALAILAEIGTAPAGPDTVWGVWTAEPTRVRAERRAGGWHLAGEKRWCSGADALDRALVSATGPDGPRLFVIEPRELEAVDGSWPSIGMEATASVTMRFDVQVAADAAVGGPDAYVTRAGFWHGGAGVAAVWFGGAVGVAEHLRLAASAAPTDHHLVAVWGRVHARLDAAGALLVRSAREIDDAPSDVAAAHRRTVGLRLAVEDAASFTLDETVRALGAGTLAHDRSYATRVADLQLYLRQLRSEAAACELGDLAAVEPIRW